MKILALSENLSQLWWYNFSQKWEKCKTWVFEHQIKLDYVQNFRKTLQSQNWALKMFYDIFHAHFKEYWNLQFLVKIGPKITFYIVRVYYIIVIYLFSQCKSITICNMRSRDDQKLTCAQIHEHPFTKWFQTLY